MINPACFGLSLDREISREEIECDPEIILVRNLRETLKKLNTNLNGLRGKKFGFREVVEMVNVRSTFPTSPDTSIIKRSRTSMGHDFLATTSVTQTTINDKENPAKKSRCDYDSSSSSESIASAHDEQLGENMKESEDTLMKAEKLSDKFDKVSGVDNNDNNVPGINHSKGVKKNVEYKPSNLRIERMRNIQRKKPKFNVSNLDLVYHSNMARNFPGSEYRSQEQQLRRDKNTLAARISRTKNKAYEKMLEKESVEVTSENITMKRKIACLRVYADSLMKLNGLPATNFTEMWESNLKYLID